MSEPLPPTVRRSLRYSIIEGIFHSWMVGCGETFLVPFAVYLTASSLQVALLSCLPMFLGSLPQLVAGRLVRICGSRKKLVVRAAVLQALFWLPIAGCAFVGWAGVWLLILLACLYWSSGMILQPAWGSWMADLVPREVRGRFFGDRGRQVQLAAFLALVAGGFILRGAEAFRFVQFVFLFAMAAASRLLSGLFLKLQEEPRPSIVPLGSARFLEFLRTMHRRNFGWLVLYLCLVNFAVHLAAPYYIPYLLRDLETSYALMTFLIGIPVLAKYVFFPVWGRVGDRYGSRRVLVLAGFVMPVTPILWSVSGNVTYLAVVQVLSGFIWAAYDLASYNFLLEATSPRNRIVFIGYYGILNSFAALAGSLVGWGVLLIDTGAASRLPFLFLVSGLLRWLPAVFLLNRIRETRIVESVSYRDLVLRVFTIRPTRGITVRPVVMDPPGRIRVEGDSSRGDDTDAGPLAARRPEGPPGQRPAGPSWPEPPAPSRDGGSATADRP